MSTDYGQQIVEAASRESRADEYRDSVEGPPDTEVALPGGLFDPFTGSVSKTAVVREINGWDEEVLARLAARPDASQGEQLIALVERATVSVGDEPATRENLDLLYSGDWDALLLAIRIASFGPTVAWRFPCQGCDGEDRVVTIDLASDVKPHEIDPVVDDGFEVVGKRSTYEVSFPKGDTNRRLFRNKNATSATLITETLYGSIQSIDGQPVTDVSQIKSLPSADRELIFMKINNEMPSLRLEEVTTTCSECESKVHVPLSLAALFQGRTFAV